MRPRTNAHKHTPTHIHARRCSLSCKRSTTGSGWRGRTDALPSTTKSWASAGHLTPRQGQTSAPSPTPSPPCSPPGATSPSPSRYVSCLPLSLTQCFVRARVQMFRSRRLFVSATKMVLHLPPLLFPIAPDHSTVSDSIWLSLFLVCVQDVDGEATLVEIGPTPEPYVPLTTPQPSAESWPSQQSTTQDGYTRVISGPGLVQVRAHWGFGTIFFFFFAVRKKCADARICTHCFCGLRCAECALRCLMFPFQTHPLTRAHSFVHPQLAPPARPDTQESDDSGYMPFASPNTRTGYDFPA